MRNVTPLGTLHLYCILMGFDKYSSITKPYMYITSQYLLPRHINNTGYIKCIDAAEIVWC